MVVPGDFYKKAGDFANLYLIYNLKLDYKDFLEELDTDGGLNVFIEQEIYTIKILQQKSTPLTEDEKYYLDCMKNFFENCLNRLGFTRSKLLIVDKMRNIKF